MMRKAREMQRALQNQVVFLDFYNKDFDESVTLTPVSVNRNFWTGVLDVALADLAKLVAPQQIVLCEGRPVGQTSSNNAKAEFDAACYRIIFAQEFPDTDFISVGNEQEVRQDQVGIGRTIQTLTQGTTIIRVVDQDDRSTTEIAQLQAQGIQVLSKRHLEAFLLDDEIIKKLCDKFYQPNKVIEAKRLKEDALVASISRGNSQDDVKSASGDIYVALKRLLGLTKVGNTSNTFLRDTMAELVTPDTNMYAQLRSNIFQI